MYIWASYNVYMVMLVICGFNNAVMEMFNDMMDVMRTS